MGLIIDNAKLTPELSEKIIKCCPFGAIVKDGDKLSINMSCKLCKACVRKSEGVITYVEDEKKSIDKSQWRGVAVLCEHFHGKVHNVTYELIGKAKELAAVIDHPVMALVIGSGVSSVASELFSYGADEVYVYDDKGLENFMIEPYTNVFEDFISKVKPSSILVGATNLGRSLAPRIAARVGTGLTADCTSLEMDKNTDLVQIRPAFGGNIMARIISTYTRPQFCTVRYKVFPMPHKIDASGKCAKIMDVTPEMLKANTEILNIETKPAVEDISEADVLVQIGRGVKTEKDIEIIKAFADSIGAELACTRPLVENHWFDARQQIGLSGRTVKPKLLVSIGVSGAIQTVTGMKGSECIIAINKDPNAPIFDVADYGFVGDWYEILPEIEAILKKGVANVQ